jgi:hypothetical protein
MSCSGVGITGPPACRTHEPLNNTHPYRQRLLAGSSQVLAVFITPNKHSTDYRNKSTTHSSPRRGVGEELGTARPRAAHQTLSYIYPQFPELENELVDKSTSVSFWLRLSTFLKYFISIY